MTTPCYYPVKGGTETMVRNLSIKLNKIGIHTDVMTFNMTYKWKPKWKGETYRTDGITVFKIPALNWQPLTHSPRNTLGVNLIPGRFTNILKQYDIIHYHEFDLTFPMFSYFTKKPKIFHLHGLDANFLKRYRLSRIVFNNAAHLYIAISQQIRSDLKELGIPENKVIYLPNGIDTELFHPTDSREDNLIIFVGRISPEKGLHILLKALNHLETSIRLVVIGPFWDSNYYQDIRKLAETEKTRGKHKIEFLGALDLKDVISWYQKASILVLPSFSEGLPVVVLEALSCETSVIATSVGGIPDIVKDLENGLLFPPGNPHKLAEEIQYLLNDRTLRDRLGREGRKRMIENFSLDTAVDRLNKLYVQILISQKTDQSRNY